MNQQRTGDQIVYADPGGVDGRDPNDEGGVIRFASFDKAEATNKVDAWSKLHKLVVDVDEQREKALKKLTPLDLLALGVTNPGDEPEE